MKMQSVKTYLILSLVMMIGAASASAQRSPGRIVVNIPFDFVVGRQTLPAGEYTVQNVGRHSDKELLLRRADGRATALMITAVVEAPRPHREARLVFHRYEDKYFLAQVWARGMSAGRELSKSQLERALERELAKNAAAGTTAKNTPKLQIVTLTGDGR